MTLQANAIRKQYKTKELFTDPDKALGNLEKIKAFFLMLNTFAAFVVMVKLIVLGWYLP